MHTYNRTHDYLYSVRVSLEPENCGILKKTLLISGCKINKFEAQFTAVEIKHKKILT